MGVIFITAYREGFSHGNILATVKDVSSSKCNISSSLSYFRIEGVGIWISTSEICICIAIHITWSYGKSSVLIYEPNMCPCLFSTLSFNQLQQQTYLMSWDVLSTRYGNFTFAVMCTRVTIIAIQLPTALVPAAQNLFKNACPYIFLIMIPSPKFLQVVVTPYL